MSYLEHFSVETILWFRHHSRSLTFSGWTQDQAITTTLTSRAEQISYCSLSSLTFLTMEFTRFSLITILLFSLTHARVASTSPQPQPGSSLAQLPMPQFWLSFCVICVWIAASGGPNSPAGPELSVRFPWDNGMLLVAEEPTGAGVGYYDYFSTVLAAQRTSRRNPLNGFNKYSGGWNISDTNYWAVRLSLSSH